MTKSILYTDTPEFYNEICEEIRLFFSADKVELVEEPLDEIPKHGLILCTRLPKKTGKDYRLPRL